ncbi:MAG: hypothetical protein JWO36_523 [Myxococcales bacterium]|nr:hypothetical protein [Myxococcales bacterium]
MQMLSAHAALIAKAAGPQLRPLKRVEYDRLAAEGFFEHERVELLCGMVVSMPPLSVEHNESVSRLHRLLDRQLADRAIVRSQSSFPTSDDSEPEPDIYVIPNGSYWKQHPERAFLVVEVARSSVERDRAKQYLYANGRVDEYWIVNHEQGKVEVYREPRDGVWRVRTVHQRGESVSPVAFPDVRISVGDVLPPADIE